MREAASPTPSTAVADKEATASQGKVGRSAPQGAVSGAAPVGRAAKRLETLQKLADDANGPMADLVALAKYSGPAQRLGRIQKAADGARPPNGAKPQGTLPVPPANRRALQRAASYNGAKISSYAGSWGPKNLGVNDQINYGGTTGQNTANWGHADRIDSSWGGSAPAALPTDWAKFSQLVGPYSATDIVQGHMINEGVGGAGIAANLAPLTRSANARHSTSIEKPIRAWLAADADNLIDYKVVPVYGGAAKSLKNTLIAKHKQTVAEGTGDTTPNLKAWVGQYIDATIPSQLDVVVEFGQVNSAGRVRKKGQLQGAVSNRYAAAYNGDNISGNAGGYVSKWVYGFADKISYGGLEANNTGKWGHADRIAKGHLGFGVFGHRPDDWLKFAMLVGPDAITEFVQGHLINEKIGGFGVAGNLVPLTNSANSSHWNSVEAPIRSWLGKRNTAKGYAHVVDYTVTAQYGGADPGLKKDLLDAFDDTNAEVTGAKPGNLLAWVGGYIDATFPRRLDVDVKFMQRFGSRARAKPSRVGSVTNEP